MRGGKRGKEEKTALFVTPPGARKKDTKRWKSCRPMESPMTPGSVSYGS